MPGRIITKERMMRRDSQPKRLWSAALAHTTTERVIAVVMGVSGSGKNHDVSVVLSGPRLPVPGGQ
jgi:ABC-type proline/glycine betaine transport system ATPase subunit